VSWVEKDFEEQMRPLIDEAYRKVFSAISKITRCEKDENSNQLILDTEFAIDTIIRFIDGSLLTLQEKVRRFEYYKKYNDFTFEYFNNPDTEEQGEWFKLASQFYFYGFATPDESDFARFYILNVGNFRIFLKKNYGNNLFERVRRNKPPCRANFITIPFDEIPDFCLLYDSAKTPTNAATLAGAR